MPAVREFECPALQNVERLLSVMDMKGRGIARPDFRDAGDDFHAGPREVSTLQLLAEEGVLGVGRQKEQRCKAIQELFSFQFSTLKSIAKAQIREIKPKRFYISRFICYVLHASLT